MNGPSDAQQVVRGKKKDPPRFSFGCLFISLGFLIFGAFFLWAFFTHARSRGPGNPVMGLVFGSFFSVLGLGGIAVLLLTLLKRRR